MTNMQKMEKICIVALSVMLTGCGSEGAFNEEPSEKRFKVLDGEIFDNFYIAYDTETGIEYTVTNGLYNHGTLTILVDADGKPLIYEGWKNEGKQSNNEG